MSVEARVLLSLIWSYVWFGVILKQPEDPRKHYPVFVWANNHPFLSNLVWAAGVFLCLYV